MLQKDGGDDEYLARLQQCVNAAMHSLLKSFIFLLRSPFLTLSPNIWCKMNRTEMCVERTLSQLLKIL